MVARLRGLVHEGKADCVAVQCSPVNAECSCAVWERHLGVPVVPLVLLIPWAAEQLPVTCRARDQLVEELLDGRGFFYLRRVKPLVDRLLVLASLPVTLPLGLIAGLLVKATSRGPVLYKQDRVGLGGKQFVLAKLRTMVDGAEDETGPVWSPPGDERVTPLGRVLRSLHVDELPQLWSVLRGDMSLVGPRPERPCFVERLSGAIPLYSKRLSVRPGITGWAQVHRGGDQSLADVREKLSYDLYYLSRSSLGLDLRILWLTALRLLGFTH